MKRKQPLSKKETVELWKKRLEGAQALIIFDYRKIKAGEIAALRRQSREAGFTVGVVKNSLLQRALEGRDLAVIGPKLVGTIGVAIAKEETKPVAQALLKFADGNENFKILGGALANSLLDAEGVKGLSTAPGKPELRAQFLSLLATVPTNFVRLLAAAPTNFLLLLTARKAKLEEGAAPAA